MGRYLALMMLVSIALAIAVPTMALSPPASVCGSVSQAAIADLAARGVSQALMSRLVARIGDGSRDEAAIKERVTEWVNYVAAHQDEFERTPASVIESWLNSDPTLAEYAVHFPTTDQANQCVDDYVQCLANCYNLGNPVVEVICVDACTLLELHCFFFGPGN